MRGKRLHTFDVRGHGPHLFVRIPLAVGKHAGSADAMFDDPKDLRLGVLGADQGQLGNRRKQYVTAVLLETLPFRGLPGWMTQRFSPRFTRVPPGGNWEKAGTSPQPRPFWLFPE